MKYLIDEFIIPLKNAENMYNESKIILRNLKKTLIREYDNIYPDDPIYELLRCKLINELDVLLFDSGF